MQRTTATASPRGAGQTRLRVAIAHNGYLQAGGEDRVVAAEAAMLRRQGHEVEVLAFDNEAITGVRAQARAAVSSFYSVPAYRRVSRALRSFRPEVLHVHNFLPTLSASVFFAAESAAIPVVQTLHNYRLICANAQLFREGAVCERCVQAGSMLPGVRFGCYRGSRAGTAVVGGMVAIHAGMGTWNRRVARYIALSEFAAAKLGGHRVPADKISVKPNFVLDSGTGAGGGGYALFVGRLSAEKGLATLLEADRLRRLPLPIWIAGDGPLRAAVEEACARPGSRLVYLGHQTSQAVRELMKEAAVLLVPSLWYEGFPLVMVEALSLGLPVIASRIGGLPEIVEDEVCGFLHEPGAPDALLQALERFARAPSRVKEALRAGARSRYLERYSEEANYQQLMEIYADALRQN